MVVFGEFDWFFSVVKMFKMTSKIAEIAEWEITCVFFVMIHCTEKFRDHYFFIMVVFGFCSSNHIHQSMHHF